jgi:hypothetical protein
MLGWMLASAPFWMGGAIAEPGRRLWWWSTAVVIDVAGTWLAHPWPRRRLHTENVPFDSAHMAERLRLRPRRSRPHHRHRDLGIPERPRNPGRRGRRLRGHRLPLGALLRRMEYIVEHHITQTTNPVWSARMAGNGAYLVVAGLVAVAVGCELRSLASWVSNLYGHARLASA